MSNSAAASPSRTLLIYLTPAFVALALVYGGATHGEALSSAVVRLAAIALLLCAMQPHIQDGVRPVDRWPLAVLGLGILIPIIQLIPLPPQVWTALPGREAVTEGFRTGGVALPWLPISLAPSATVDALLSLVPPAAVFLAIISLDERARRRVSLIVIAVTLAGTLIGAAQVASGQDSSLRFYEVTNTDSAVGFFANRNHYAALLAITLPLTAYWLAYSESRSRGQRVVYMLIAAGFLVIFVVSLGVTRSRAGIGLGAAAILASAAVLWFSKAVPRIVPVVLIAGMVVGGGLISLFALEPLLNRFHDPVSNEARVNLLPGLMAAAKTYFPVGSGLGSFVPVFQMFEHADTMLPRYVNHAHDDYIELIIETGVMGAAVLTAGLGWIVTAAVRSAGWPQGRDPDLQRVAAVIVAILLVHSVVDYPLRTAALSVMFALACGLLTPPPFVGGRSRRSADAPANDGGHTGGARRLLARPYVTTRSRRS